MKKGDRSGKTKRGEREKREGGGREREEKKRRRREEGRKGRGEGGRTGARDGGECPGRCLHQPSLKGAIQSSEARVPVHGGGSSSNNRHGERGIEPGEPEGSGLTGLRLHTPRG